jgi:hypothetical protein
MNRCWARAALVGMLTVLVLLVPPQRALAASTPVIAGKVAMIEVCAQDRCGAAIFTGVFDGTVGGRHRIGTATVAVTHTTPLPPPEGMGSITGGAWQLHVRDHRFRGAVLPGGTLVNNGNNTFTIIAVLALTEGGTGTINVSVLLDHNTSPPTVKGTISQ